MISVVNSLLSRWEVVSRNFMIVSGKRLVMEQSCPIGEESFMDNFIGTSIPHWFREMLTDQGNIHYSSQGQEGESKERDLDERGGICSYHG